MLQESICLREYGIRPGKTIKASVSDDSSGTDHGVDRKSGLISFTTEVLDEYPRLKQLRTPFRLAVTRFFTLIQCGEGFSAAR